MTTQTIRQDSESSAQCGATSPTLDHAVEGQSLQGGNAFAFRLLNFDCRTPSAMPLGAADSKFEQLKKSSEANAVHAKALSDGRKWVAKKFYAERTLAVLRLAAGMSQRQLAEACGVEQPHISRYESGRTEPGITISRRMAMALGVTTDDFAAAWEASRTAMSSQP